MASVGNTTSGSNGDGVGNVGCSDTTATKQLFDIKLDTSAIAPAEPEDGASAAAVYSVPTAEIQPQLPLELDPSIYDWCPEDDLNGNPREVQEELPDELLDLDVSMRCGFDWDPIVAAETELRDAPSALHMDFEIGDTRTYPLLMTTQQQQQQQLHEDAAVIADMAATTGAVGGGAASGTNRGCSAGGDGGLHGALAREDGPSSGDYERTAATDARDSDVVGVANADQMQHVVEKLINRQARLKEKERRRRARISNASETLRSIVHRLTAVKMNNAWASEFIVGFLEHLKPHQGPEHDQEFMEYLQEYQRN